MKECHTQLMETYFNSRSMNETHDERIQEKSFILWGKERVHGRKTQRLQY